MTQLPFGLGNLDWSDWIRGLLSGFISGGSAAVTGGVVVGGMDPEHFPLGSMHSITLMFTIFAVAGTFSGFAFLRTKPLPEMKQVTSMTKDIAPKPGGGAVVTTVMETHTEPVTPPAPVEVPKA